MCPSFSLSLLTGTGICSVVFELTRWVQDALNESTPMQNIHFMMCEVCYLNGESGLLSHMSVSSQLSAVSFVAVCNPLMEPDLKSVRGRLQLEHFHLF